MNSLPEDWRMESLEEPASQKKNFSNQNNHTKGTCKKMNECSYYFDFVLTKSLPNQCAS